MFERFTEEARRDLFFARYEASQRGSFSIESDHLLLGLTREHHGTVSGILAQFHVSPEIVLREVDSRAPSKEKTPPSVEIPFSGDVKTVLSGARDEADRLKHPHIGPEHLLLALLNEDRSGTASMLTELGVTLQAARDYVAT